MAMCEPLVQKDEVFFPSTSSTIPESESGRSNGDGKFPISHPNHIFQKLLALTLMCVVGLGSCFCYDNPASLQDHFIKYVTLSTSEFVLLYSWYCWPSAALCFIGGFLIDRVFGIRLGTIIYASLVVLGQLIFAYGVFMNRFWLTILGRFIFGIGGESLAVAQNSYAVIWFKGKELNMVFGFQSSMSNVGSTMNFLLMEPLYNYMAQYYDGYQRIGITLFIACLPCVLSIVCSMVLALQDKNAERILNRKQNETNEAVKLQDVKYFPLSFWLATFMNVFYCGAVFSFISLDKVFFERKYDIDPGYANFVNSISPIISAVLAPFFGVIIDRYGQNLTFVFGSLLVTIVGHMLLAFTFINPLISMCVIGVAYSMMLSASLPLIALVTPNHLLGTAFGIAQSFFNLGLGIVQLIIGKIVDNYGYFLLEAFFISCLNLAVLMVLIMWIHDAMHTGYLNMDPRQRLIFDQQNKAPSTLTEYENLLDSDLCSVFEEEPTDTIPKTFQKDN